MKRFWLGLFVGVICLAGAGSLRAAPTRTLELGVLAYEDPARVEAKFKPLADYLDRELPEARVHLQVLSGQALEKALAGNRLDILITNPVHYVALRSRSALSGALATLNQIQNGQTTAAMGGVVVTRVDNPHVRQLRDLKGRRLVYPAEHAALAFQAVGQELDRIGLTLGKEIPLIRGGSNGAVLDAVLAGEAEVGLVRTSILEAQIAAGKLQAGDLRVINAQDLPSYPFLVSTRLYPDWPFVVFPRMNEDTSRRLSRALLALGPRHPVSQAMGIGGFSPPADYLPVEQLMRERRVPPFDHVAPLTLKMLWDQYQATVISLGMMALLVVGLLIRLWQRNQRLHVVVGALEASEQKHRSYIEQAPQAIFVTDPTGKFEEANPAMASLLGIEAADFGRIDITALWKHPERDCLQIALPRLLQDGELETESILVQPDGSERIVGLRLIVLENGHIMGFCRDITERRQLAMRRLLLEQALDQFDDAAYLINDRAEFEYVNQGACRMLGYERDILMTLGVAGVDAAFPADQWGNHWDSLKAAGRLVVESKHRNRQGDIFPVEISANYLEFNGQGFNIAIARDVSRHKELEAQLTAARDNAEKLASARSQFMANMSHEIRTPINAVLGFSRMGVRDAVDVKTGQLFRNIESASTHLLGVVNDILDFAKLEAGKVQIELQPLSLTHLAGDLQGLMAQSARLKGLQFAIDCQVPAPAWVLGDGQRIRQILMNLLGNAVKFTPAGQVTLAISQVGEQGRFVICDTGIGMTAEQLSRVFQPFEQADNSTTRRFGGSGLGLVISRNLAEQMGGTITVESREGEGSCFTLTLPLPATNAPAEAAAMDTSLAEPHPLAGLRILVAEDEPFNWLVIQDLLEEAGAVSELAADGQAAVDRVLASETSFDIVLMDIQMPRMDGYQATAILRAQRPDLPIIGLTAHAMAEEKTRCLAAGMVAHLLKPVDPPLLITTIRQSLVGTLPRSIVPATGLRVDSPLTLPEAMPSAISEMDWGAFSEACGDKPAFIKKLLAAVIEGHADSPAQLRQLLAAADWSALSSLAHRLKSVTGNLQAPALMDLAYQIETGAKAAAPDVTGLTDGVAALAGRLERLLGELRQRLTD